MSKNQLWCAITKYSSHATNSTTNELFLLVAVSKKELLRAVERVNVSFKRNRIREVVLSITPYDITAHRTHILARQILQSILFFYPNRSDNFISCVQLTHKDILSKIASCVKAFDPVMNTHEYFNLCSTRD